MWTDNDIEILKHGYKNGILPKVIAEQTGKTVRAVISKASVIGVSKEIRVFSQVEKEALVDWYNTHKDALELEGLSTKLNRTVPYLCRKARELGLTKIGRKPEAMIDNLTKRLTEYNQTPDGIENRKRALISATKAIKDRNIKPFGGKTHSKEMRDKMSIRVKEAWQDPNSAFNSEICKQKRSDNMSNRQIQGKVRNAYSRGHQGKRADISNMYFRSCWEANYARYLNTLIASGSMFKWEYEPDTFVFHEIKRGTRSYLPDFKIWETEDSEPYYIEVKGWMDDKSKTKLNRMRIYYPKVKIIIVGEKEYNELKKQYSKVIEGWE